MPRPPLPGTLPLALALLALLAPAAHAADRERVLTLSADYARLELPAAAGELALTGGALGLTFQRGWGDTLLFRAAVAGGLHAAPDGLARAGSAVIGITYVIDILRYVPTIDLGVGVLVASGPGLDTAAHPILELGLGFDVLESRSLSWGVAVHYDAFASPARSFTIGPRLSWRWGYF
ncbi:MAG: hypothetical protein EXR73_11735 [Myxococcales bacterium]|nr:hypothetical protein [Myxococcales bacterium]